METRSVSLWKTLDWVTIVIYLLLIIGGWFSVCGASLIMVIVTFWTFQHVPVGSLCGLSVPLGLVLYS